MTIRTLLTDAERELRGVSDSPRLDAELLLAHALKKGRSFLVAHGDEPVAAAIETRFEAFMTRRRDGEPVAYILGQREFWSLPLSVTPATLVPRPETERLVELALEWIVERDAKRIVDLGTGSGAIALAIASERPDLRIVAVDNSRAALTVAQKNAQALSLENIDFVLSNWTAELNGESFDLVLSNPPYVADDDEALASLRAEPQSALVSGNDGLDDIRQLAGEVRGILGTTGRFLLEHGDTQSDAVRDILSAAGWSDIRSWDDHAGKPRVSGASRG